MRQQRTGMRWVRNGAGSLLAVAPLLACTPADAPRPDSAVLLVLDTLRADRLGVYGHDRDTSPRLDALAERGVVFDQVISNASWTLPAMVGLLSGRYPTAAVFDRTLETSLIEGLGTAGWNTAAFTEGGYFSRAFRLDRGFLSYHEEEGEVRLSIRGQPYHRSAGGDVERTFRLAEEWLEANGSRRFFLLIHTYEVHTPYRRRSYAEDLDPGVLGETLEISDVRRIRDGELPIGETERSYVKALYDGGVRRVDAAVGELLSALDRLGLADSTLVAVTSDHGEELGDRSPEFTGDHGHSLHDELLRVPLILYNPLEQYPVRRVAAQARSVDVLPTLFDVLGAPLPEGLDGRSLVPLMRGAREPERPAYAEVWKHSAPQFSLRQGGYKLIVHSPSEPQEPPALELYDLSQDAGERANVVEQRPERAAELDAGLRAQIERLSEAGRANYDSPSELPRDTLKRLESLGYLE